MKFVVTTGTREVENTSRTMGNYYKAFRVPHFFAEWFPRKDKVERLVVVDGEIKEDILTRTDWMPVFVNQTSRNKIKIFDTYEDAVRVLQDLQLLGYRGALYVREFRNKRIWDLRPDVDVFKVSRELA